MRRELGQLSLADGLVEGGAGRNRQLERLASLVDWTGFERLRWPTRCPIIPRCRAFAASLSGGG